MQIKTSHLAVALLFAVLHSQHSNLFAQGSLTPPPGAPVPTMKTLTQIEPRTPISSAPFTITVPGSYYLTTNLTVSGGDAITIATNGVALDLSGFTLASTNPTNGGVGILINEGLRNLTVVNGFILGGVTNDGSGGYSGSGFASGIYGLPQSARVSRVSVSGCRVYGISLGLDQTVVESCTVRSVGGPGIIATIIKTSLAWCSGSAIFGYQVTDCRGLATGVGTSGVYANVAQNCNGESATGTGVKAHLIASSCYGESLTGTGLEAETAQNCWGDSYSGIGLYASKIAIGCSGNSSNGTGLSAYIANSCFGSSSSGTAQNITFKYNMP